MKRRSAALTVLRSMTLSITERMTFFSSGLSRLAASNWSCGYFHLWRSIRLSLMKLDPFDTLVGRQNTVGKISAARPPVLLDTHADGATKDHRNPKPQT